MSKNYRLLGCALVLNIVASLFVLAPAAVAHNRGRHCTAGYGRCLHPASDYDCAGGSGNGPRYVYSAIRVTGSDPYGLDSDNDGWGCE
jgi:hypothetical protein